MARPYPRTKELTCIRIPGVTGASLGDLSTVQMCEENTKEGRKRECGKGAPCPQVQWIGTSYWQLLNLSLVSFDYYNITIFSSHLLLSDKFKYFCGGGIVYKSNSLISSVLVFNSMDLQCVTVMPSEKSHNYADCRTKKMQFICFSSAVQTQENITI
jgi:hypothetical protein